MIYTIQWPKTSGKFKDDSRVLSWGGIVIDATPAMQWAVGKTIESTLSWVEQWDAIWKLMPGSERKQSL